VIFSAFKRLAANSHARILVATQIVSARDCYDYAAQ
jgi:hypothetical protein